MLSLEYQCFYHCHQPFIPNFFWMKAQYDIKKSDKNRCSLRITINKKCADRKYSTIKKQINSEKKHSVFCNKPHALDN